MNIIRRLLKSATGGVITFSGDAVELWTPRTYTLTMWPLRFWARIHPHIFTRVDTSYLTTYGVKNGRSCWYFQAGPFYVFHEKRRPL